jgi:hypothetical protein
MPAFTLMEHQVEGVDFIDAHDGIAALLYDPGVGKQQPVSEPVLTPSGWVSIGTLVPGDEVMAMDGTPTEVLSVHPQTERTVFKVVMNDGSYTYAGPEHLWLARTHNHARRNTDYSVVTTDTLRAEHHKRWEIPMAQPVQFPETDAMDAYLAGVIAGDGSCGGRGVELCTDVEIISSLGLSLSRLHETASYVGYAYVPVAQHNHEFKGQRSWEKELPLAVVRGSVDQRYAALQGLLDTDGSPIATGGVEYSTASETLADQVKWLVESLGGSARAGVVRAPKYTYKGETLEGRLSYRLNIKMPSGLAPFRLSRKLAAWVAPTKYPVKRCVKSVEFSHHEDSVCIRVAHPTSTYLTRSFIVTHNTGTTLTWVDQQAARLAKSKQPREFRVLVVAPKTACDTWVLQVAGFMDATVKARFLTGQTKTILTKIRAAADWRKVPDSTIKANHKGDPRVSGNAKVTILAISSGSISSWCRDDHRHGAGQTAADGPVTPGCAEVRPGSCGDGREPHDQEPRCQPVRGHVQHRAVGAAPDHPHGHGQPALPARLLRPVAVPGPVDVQRSGVSGLCQVPAQDDQGREDGSQAVGVGAIREVVCHLRGARGQAGHGGQPHFY